MFKFLRRSPRAEHRFCQENLSPFLDGQLTARERDRLERHLQECAACRAELESLRQTVRLLRAVPTIKPPRSFFIPASAGIRQRQVRRSRLAYGYLRMATGVAAALLVLVVSGDALLRFAPVRPARQLMAPVVETTAVEGGVRAPAAMPTQAAEMPVAAPAPPTSEVTLGQPPEPTAVTAFAQAPGAGGATETEKAVADSEALAAKAMPSQTFGRPAGAPPLPTTTVETALPLAEESTQPTPTIMVEPTAVSPTATPVPKSATPLPTVEMPSPQPPHGKVERSEPPPGPAGLWVWLEAVQPFVPWLEGTLAAVVAVLLAATLWLRRRQRAT